MEDVRRYLIAGAFLVFAFWAFRRRAEMEVRIENGRLRVVRGRVPPHFVDELAPILEHERIESGWIRSTPAGNRTRLSFSKSIPEGVRQQIRNIWFARRRVEKPAW